MNVINDRRMKRVDIKPKEKKRVTFLPPLPLLGKAHENDSVGPARYKVEHNKTGTYGPKWSAASRHMEGVNAGHPNNLVQPVDTHGEI